jgi:glycosyltransferase 2 family protein
VLPDLPAWIRRGLRLLLTFAACLWIVRHLERSAAGLAWPPSPEWACLAGSVLLLAANIPLRALKWLAILRHREKRATFRESLTSYLGAMPLSMITPGRVGEVSRVLYLPHASLRGWRAAALLAADKLTDLLSVGVWSVAGFTALFGLRGFLASAAGVAAAACLPSLFLRAPFFRGLREASGPGALGALRRILGQAVPDADLLAPRRMALPLALGMAAYGVEWLQFSLLVDAFTPGPVPYPPLAGLTAVIILANAFQLTIGGLGLREGLSMVLLAPLGIPAEAALAAAFGMFVVGQALPSLAGLAVRPRAAERAAASA